MKTGKVDRVGLKAAAITALIWALLFGLAPAACQNKDNAPADKAPADKLPVEKLPVDKPPEDNPPADKLPVDKLPAAGVLSENELKPMLLESMMEFNSAIQLKDFTSFHAYISETWQKQITAQELLSTFKPFIDAEIDLSPIQNLDPVFDVPSWIGDDGLLETVGHYPSKPSQTAFTLSYVNEKGKWKLIGINVQVYPPEQMVPFDPVLAKLAKATLTDFAKAVKDKDFTAFHKNISTLWKQQITPEGLKDAFQSFIDNKIDLSGVAKSEPAVDPGAAIDGDGMLSFTGSVPLGSSKLNYKLSYIFEDGKWKLAAIDVKFE